ncbi:MAG: selenocysteine synthase [Acidobacteria bacterium]|nr:selenocysteine synthase [Acidobacteriota bacterium]
MATTRRNLLKGSLLAAAPLRAARSARPVNIYQELGIRPVINCRGTHTVLGASKKWPDLDAAMAEASRSFVLLSEVQEKVGERLSKLIGTESAMVTTGAAGAIALGAYACLTGSDVKKVRQLPDLEGMKSEVVIQKVHRNGYDHAVRTAGVKIVEVETREQLEAAAGPSTAMMYFLGGTTGDWAFETPLSLEECVAVGRRAGFPVLVDAANMLPPWENIRKVAAAGAELIAISGGKHMRGPQCSGILAGRKDLIAAALLNSSPNSDSSGRPMKVGREEMVGVWLAAEKYAKLDFAALDRQYREQCEYIHNVLKKVPGLSVGYMPFEKVRKIPRVYVQWDEKAKGLTTNECVRQLLDGDPRIAVLKHEQQGIYLTMFMADPGDEKVVVRRLKEIFRG